MDRLKDKHALITGGTTGIGLETARQFFKEGAKVAVTGVNPATLNAAREQLGSEALILASDAGNVAAQQELAADVGSAFGRLDILVVNAGIVDMRPLEKWDEAAFDRSFDINCRQVALHPRPGGLGRGRGLRAFVGRDSCAREGSSGSLGTTQK